MSREIRRKLNEGRTEAARAKDVLRQSFEKRGAAIRSVMERTEQRRDERVLQIWKDAVSEVKNNKKEGA